MDRTPYTQLKQGDNETTLPSHDQAADSSNQEKFEPRITSHHSRGRMNSVTFITAVVASFGCLAQAPTHLPAPR
jgi:hypothetical protein